MPRLKAFTLLELLVVIAIMFLLITIAIVSFGGVREAANRTTSLNALRQMAAGFNSYSSDHNGRFLPGYVGETEMDDPTDIEILAILPGDIRLSRVTDSCSSGQCDRSSYVWRLSSYLSDHWETMFVDYHDPQLIGSLEMEFENDIYGPGTVAASDFGISEIPSFGMNSVFIGGDSFHGGSAITNFHPWQTANNVMAATRLSAVKNPSRIILFASSMRDPDAGGPNGSAFNVEFGSPELRPPYLEFDNNGVGNAVTRQWEFGATVNEKGVIISSASATYINGGGWPIARWGDDLVPTAHLDGSTTTENRIRLGADGSFWSPTVIAPARAQDGN